MKRPSFQFYPGDWLRDTALRSCSVSARGLWMDMLCLMHDGAPYGHLKVGGKVILPPNLARMIGATLLETEGYLLELEDAGVFSRMEDGTMFCRRMIRDETIRVKRAAGGIKGGNPALKKPAIKVNLTANLKPTPSSSSSSAIIPPTPEPSAQVGGEKDIRPKTPEALAVAAIFGRKPSTEWSDKEISAFRKLVKRGVMTMEAMECIAIYYKIEQAKKEDGRHRRDLATFLNNFDGELDRSRAAFPKKTQAVQAWMTQWPEWLKTNGHDKVDYQFAPEFLKTDFHKEIKSKAA